MKKTTKRPEWLRKNEGRKKAERIQVRQARQHRKHERETMTLAIGGTA